MQCHNVQFSPQDLVNVTMIDWCIPSATLCVQVGQTVSSLHKVFLDEELMADLVDRRELFPRALWTARLWQCETEHIVRYQNIVAAGQFERVRAYFELCPRAIFDAARAQLEAALTPEVFSSLNALREGKLASNLCTNIELFALCMRGMHKDEFTPDHWRDIAAMVTDVDNALILLRDCTHAPAKKLCFLNCTWLLSEEDIDDYVTEGMVSAALPSVYYELKTRDTLPHYMLRFPRAFIDSADSLGRMSEVLAEKYLLPYVTENDVMRHGNVIVHWFAYSDEFARRYWRPLLKIDGLKHVNERIQNEVVLPEVTHNDVAAYPAELARIFGNNAEFSRTYAATIYAARPSAIWYLLKEDIMALGITTEDLVSRDGLIEITRRVRYFDHLCEEIIQLRHPAVENLPNRFNPVILANYGYDVIANSGPDMVRRFADDPVFMQKYALVAVLNNIDNMQCFHSANKNGNRIKSLAKQFAPIPFETAFAADMDNAVFYRKYLARRPYLQIRALLAGASMRAIGVNATQLRRMSDASIFAAVERASRTDCPWRGQLHKVHLAVDQCPREGWLGVIPRDMFVLIMQYVWNCEMV